MATAFLSALPGTVFRAAWLSLEGGDMKYRTKQPHECIAVSSFYPCMPYHVELPILALPTYFGSRLRKGIAAAVCCLALALDLQGWGLVF